MDTLAFKEYISLRVSKYYIQYDLYFWVKGYWWSAYDFSNVHYCLVLSKIEKIWIKNIRNAFNQGMQIWKSNIKPKNLLVVSRMNSIYR